jgi:hypothetical protein
MFYTTFSNPVNIFLPNFTIYKNKMDHIVASDQRSHLSLKKMAARVKQQNIIYSSLAESMLDGEIKIDDNYWSLTSKKCCNNAKFTGCNLVKFVGLSLQEET